MKIHLITQLTENIKPEEVGGKAFALARLSGAGFSVPEWFVVSAEAFNAPRGNEGQVVSPDDLWACVAELKPDEALSGTILEHLNRMLSSGETVAVRSSALDEDGAEASFAGQLESYLFVQGKDVPGKVAEVWKSGFTERVIAYRGEVGLPPPAKPPAVLVQRMVNAEKSGVAFACDPVSGRRSVAVVSAVFGLGTGLVSGDCEADTYHVDQAGTILSREIAVKTTCHRMDTTNPEGVSEESLPQSLREQAVLNDDETRAIAELSRKASLFFGRAQDIEWAVADGDIYLLQSRPITTLNETADPDGELQIWDNSNIAESYGGITTPLTYSFARNAYAAVYVEFCRMMKVSEKRLADNKNVFDRLLGLIRGRMYYNLLNWYRVLALLPGFKVNRTFMEQMMGVQETLPDDVMEQLNSASFREKMSDLMALLRTVGGLISNHRRLDKNIEKFYARVNKALNDMDLPLGKMRPDELAAHYRSLEQRLLVKWDAPIVNDFFAMIYYGLMRKLAAKWCGDDSETLQNDLLCGLEGMISAEPARRIQEMAKIASSHPELVNSLCDDPVPRIEVRMREFPDFQTAYHEYLDKFADRCMEELKLESHTLRDDPTMLLRSVGQLARHSSNSASDTDYDLQARREAERTAARWLRLHPIRRLLFRWVLNNARKRVRSRENLRFDRTRVFGHVRQVFLELGRRLTEVNVLDDTRDVFYLEVEEILGFVEGGASSTALRELAEVRRLEFESFRGEEPPASRFTTRGIVYSGQNFQAGKTCVNKEDAVEDESNRQGIGCCPGIVRGQVRLVLDPTQVEFKERQILVTPRTDPGWILIFPWATGLLVERGSLLSHAAIVSREMGIPSVVGIAGLTSWLKDGDWVEMNGSTGLIRKVDSPDLKDIAR